MIFGKSGRRSKIEKWLLGSNKIEVVNKFKNLFLTPEFSFTYHLKDRLARANIIWSKLFTQHYLELSQKYKLLASVSKSVMCYGAEVWSGWMYDDVELLQSYF